MQYNYSFVLITCLFIRAQ